MGIKKQYIYLLKLNIKILEFTKKIYKNFIIFLNFFYKIYYYNILAKFRVLPPTILRITITLKCNLRCQPCYILRKNTEKKHELTFSEWQKTMNDPIFSNIKTLQITGGEPFLHPELIKLIMLYVNSMPKLQQLNIATNGFFTKKIILFINEIAPLLNKRKIKFFISISLDGLREIHDSARRVPGSFQKVITTIEALKLLQEKYKFIFSANCTLQQKNLYKIDEIKEYCKTKKIPLTISSSLFRIYTKEDRDRLMKALGQLSSDYAFFLKTCTKEDRDYLIKIFRQLFLDCYYPPLAYYYYNMYRFYANNNYRIFPCPFNIDAFSINCFGDISYCFLTKSMGNLRDGLSVSEVYYQFKNLIFRRQMIKTTCLHCNSACLRVDAIRNDSLRLLWFRLTKKFSWR